MRVLLAQDVIDSLEAHIAVLDEHAVIIAVNQAWIQFARANGCDETAVGVGANYITSCQHAAEVQGNLVAAEVINGIQNVLNGTLPEFSTEYSCHSPTEQRWFSMRVKPLNAHHDQVLITHDNITTFRRSAEQIREAALQQQRATQALSSIASSEALSHGDLIPLSNELTRKAALAIGVERVGVWLVDEATTELRNVNTYHASQDANTQEDSLEFHILQSIWAELGETQYLAADDAWLDPRMQAYSKARLAVPRTASTLAAAIKSGAQLLGLITFEQRDTIRHWEHADITFACQLADQVALTIVNQKRHVAEESLRKSEKHFKALFQEHAAIKLLIDPKTGEILDANKAAVEFYGWPLEELRHMRIDQINTLPLGAIKHAMADVISSKKRHFEFRHRRADNSVRDVEVYGNVIESEGRAFMYSIIHDISDRKCMESEKERLEIQNRQLAKTEGLHRMAGAVAHHFNNHLQTVIMCLDLLNTQSAKTIEEMEFIAGASRAAREAAGVSSLMLTYLGQSFAPMDPLDLGELCREILPKLRALAPAGITITEDFSTPLALISGNRAQIEQVLLNLLTNAWEAYPTGSQGEIKITVKSTAAIDIPTQNRAPAKWIPLSAAYVCIEVRDGGSGIPDTIIEKIFDPFFSTKFTGRGIGLAVVVGIVCEEQGVITVDSRPGRGSTFQVFLPLRRSSDTHTH